MYKYKASICIFLVMISIIPPPSLSHIKVCNVVFSEVGPLEEGAPSLLCRGLRLWWLQDGSNGFVKNGLQSLLGQGAAFQVLHCSNLLHHRLSLLHGDGCHLLVLQAGQSVGIIPQIDLGPHKEFRSVGAMVGNLWVPLQEKNNN